MGKRVMISMRTEDRINEDWLETKVRLLNRDSILAGGRWEIKKIYQIVNLRHCVAIK